ARLAGLAAEQAPPLRPVAHRHGQVAGAALGVVGAGGVQAAEPAQVVLGPSLAHGISSGRYTLLAPGPGWYNTAAGDAMLRGHHPGVAAREKYTWNSLARHTLRAAPPSWHPAFAPVLP